MVKRGLTVIVIATLVLLIAGIGALWYLGGIPKTQPDSDKDGLKDWEEELWDTDKNNPDSDSDGTRDGEEIAQNRDPRRADSDDRISDVNLRLQALVKNAQSQDRPLATGAVSSPAITYKISDLNLDSQETVASVKTYRDELKQALGQYGQKRVADEAELLARFLEKNDQGALVSLTLSRENHLELLKNLLSISVPESAGELHLNLINKLARLAEVIFYMTQVKAEPLLALESAQSVYERNNEFFTELVPMYKYFLDRNL